MQCKEGLCRGEEVDEDQGNGGEERCQGEVRGNRREEGVGGGEEDGFENTMRLMEKEKVFMFMDTSNLSEKQKEYVELMRGQVLSQKRMIGGYMMNGFVDGMGTMGGIGCTLGFMGAIGGTMGAMGGIGSMGGIEGTMGGIGGTHGWIHGIHGCSHLSISNFHEWIQWRYRG